MIKVRTWHAPTVRFAGVVALLVGTACAGAQPVAKAPLDPPNLVIIFTDDQGYADVGCFGAVGFKTPHLDRMATEGMRFTDFYSAASSCTPARAALMTGCYPQRVSMPDVIGSGARVGLNPDETTLAELLKSRGYATDCYGKWHLGHHPQFLPTRQGFDDYFGLPYSNDMWPHNPYNPNHPPLPLIEGEQPVAFNPDQSQLTTWYTERAVRFITANKDRPFFVYVPHAMPHVPLYVSDKFKGKSEKGIYGDVIMEIDWSVGQILDTLRRLDLDKKTLVVFTADNGPWLFYGEHAGSAGPLREGKGTTFDGGQREPCLMWWPGTIPAGSVCRELVTAMDIVPTMAALTDARLPAHTIDGRDIAPLLLGRPDARSPHEAFFFVQGKRVQAVRRGRWKLHVPHNYRSVAVVGQDGRRGEYVQKQVGVSLFDLDADVEERHNVADAHPAIVERLKGLIEAFEADLKANSRPPGRLAEAG